MTIQFDAEKHEYTVDGRRVPSVTEILNFLTASHYGAINPAILSAAAQRGTMVHETLEAIDYGAFDGLVAYEIQGYVRAYLEFLRDYKPEWYGIESMIYEPVGNYCGTVDRYGMIDGKECVVDLKTYTSPTKENYMSLMGQTCAYAYGLLANAKLTQSYRLIKRYGLFLRKDGTYRLVDCAEYEKKFDMPSSEIWTRCWDMFNFIERVKNNGNGRKK